MKKETKILPTPFLSNIGRGHCSWEISQERKTNGKEEIKHSLFADDTTVFTESSEDATDVGFELLGEIDQVTGHKVSEFSGPIATNN